MISTFLYRHSVRSISRMSAFNFPYITFLRYFGKKNMWYWHFHRVCDKLCSSFLDASYGIWNWLLTPFRYYHRRLFYPTARFCSFRSPQHSWGIKDIIYGFFRFSRSFARYSRSSWVRILPCLIFILGPLLSTGGFVILFTPLTRYKGAISGKLCTGCARRAPKGQKE